MSFKILSRLILGFRKVYKVDTWLFSLVKHYMDLYITDTALKVSRSLYCFTTSASHGDENYFPRLWGTGISDAMLLNITTQNSLSCLIM